MDRSAKYLALLMLSGLLTSMGFAQTSVLTQHNDNSRTGQNLNETTLTTSNVNVSTFGKQFSLPVDGNIFAQPLYVPNLTIGGTVHNVVYVATANNTVYAFDADSGNTTPLWSVNLGTPVPAQDICSTDEVECPYTDVIPVIGILATPVIDPSTETIYVVAKTKDSSGNYHFKLHALDLIAGGDKFNGPVEITANGFTSFTQLNRPGLLLANGMVYLAFGSVGDFPTWHGWVIAYDASTLHQMAVYNSTPQSNSVGGAGIWQTGNGLVADGNGDVYCITSNGNFDVNTGGSDYGSAYLKLNGSSLSVLDYFVPYNQAQLNPETDNVDLGSGGALLIPGSTLLVGGGKDAVMRVVDTGNMGHYNGVSDTNRQNIAGATNAPIFGSPVYWDSPNDGPLIYLWGHGDYAKAWSYNAGTRELNTPRVMQSTFQGASGWSDHAALSISASGSTAGTGILWGAMPLSGTSNPGPVPGILYAFDATDLTKELWDSQMNAARDGVGNHAKFVAPTVANGKVYLATFSGQLVVYGLNPPSSSQITFVQVNAATPQKPTSSVTVPFNFAQTQGDLNVVVVGWADTTSTIQSVADNLGNQYSPAAVMTRGSGLSQAIYYAKDILGGSNSVIVTFNQPASFPDVRVLEYSGADTANPVDVVASASGNSASASSGSATTTFANELIFGANTVWTGNQGPGANFSSRIITSPNSDLAEDRWVVTTGTYSATAPLTSSGPWVMQMVTFKAAGSGGGSPAPTVSSVSPNSGSSNGGTNVTITGTNFAAGSTVTFGGTAASNVVVSSTSITATTPAHAAGTVNVVVNDSNGSGTLTNGFTYTAVTGTIGFVQVASATPQSSSQVSVTVAYPGAQTAGDLNVVVVGWNDTSAAVQSVVDSGKNSYVLAAGPIKGTALTQAIYYAANVAGGSNSVTVTFTKAASYPDVRILEYKGLSTTAPLDVVAPNGGAAGTNGAGTTVSSGAATTSAANELIFGAGMTSGGFNKAGTSFTAEVITQDGSIAEDEAVSQTGSYSATAALGPYGSQAWVMQMVSFKAAGSGGGGPVPTVSSVSPSSGSSNGGTNVTITGTNFAAGSTVTFGGTAASNVVVVSSTSITATTPAHAAGAVNVVVNDSNGSGTLTNGFTYTTVSVGIGVVQVATPQTPQGSTASVQIQYSSPQTAGDLNVLVVGWNDTSAAVQSIADTFHNTYVLAAGPVKGTALTQAVYYAKNIVSGGGVNTVTVTFTTAASYPDIRAAEFSGLSTTAPLDVAAPNGGAAGTNGAGTTVSSGVATTSAANELIFGAGITSGGFNKQGSGFTSEGLTQDGSISEHEIVSQTGSYGATAALGPYGSQAWVMQMVAFKQ